MKLPNKKVLSLTLIAFLAFGTTVCAQAVRTITISPPTIEKTLNVGETAEGQLKVINDSDTPITFVASAQDFIVKDTIGTPEILPPNTLSNKYSAASWIGVSPANFTVAPHDKAIIDYFVQVPSDAGPGGHYAAIVYSPSNNSKLKGSGAAVNAYLGTLFYVSVNGNIKENASIIEFLAHKFQEYGPINVLALVQNNGDLHIRPQGQFSMYNFLGQKVQTKGLDQHNIFPGVSRRFDSSLGSKLMFGPYTIKLAASYGKGNNLPLNASLSVFVFPWKIALLLVLIMIAAVLGFMYAKKRKAKTEDTPNEPKSTPEAPQGPTVIS